MDEGSQTHRRTDGKLGGTSWSGDKAGLRRMPLNVEPEWDAPRSMPIAIQDEKEKHFLQSKKMRSQRVQTVAQDTTHSGLVRRLGVLVCGHSPARQGP